MGFIPGVRRVVSFNPVVLLMTDASGNWPKPHFVAEHPSSSMDRDLRLNFPFSESQVLGFLALT